MLTMLERKKSGDETLAESSVATRGTLGGTWAVPRFDHFGTRKVRPSFLVFTSMGFKDFESILIYWTKSCNKSFKLRWRLNGLISLDQGLIYLLRCCFCCHVFTRWGASVFQHFCYHMPQQKLPCNCLMDSRIGCKWTMGGWCFDDRSPMFSTCFCSFFPFYEWANLAPPFGWNKPTVSFLRSPVQWPRTTQREHLMFKLSLRVFIPSSNLTQPCWPENPT